MLIALDYDQTYTADPALWDAFLTEARARGHRVVCCSMRTEAEGEAVRAVLAGKVDEFVFTSRRSKWAAMAERGELPAIWVDDSPGWILNDAL